MAIRQLDDEERRDRPIPSRQVAQSPNCLVAQSPSRLLAKALRRLRADHPVGSMAPSSRIRADNGSIRAMIDPDSPPPESRATQGRPFAGGEFLFALPGT